MANTLYADDGSVRVTVVTGTSITGLYAPDRSMNVIEGIPGVHRGLYHPCGAMLVKVNADSPGTSTSAYSPDGFRNISTPPFTNPISGAMRCTVVAGAFSTTITSTSSGVSYNASADVEWDFVTGTYKEGTLYKDIIANTVISRASTATYVNRQGMIATAPVDTPRFTCELNTGKPLGLLLEPAATNLVIQSDNFSTSWSPQVGLTVTNNTAYAPDGTLTADTLTSVGAANALYQTITGVTAGNVYTYSIYVLCGTITPSQYKFAIFDNTNYAYIAADIIPSEILNNTTWTRVTYTFTIPIGCTSIRVYAFRNSATVTGTMYVWGAQLETGSVATSYIPTTTVQVTRASDTGFAIPASAITAGLTTTSTNLVIESQTIDNVAWIKNYVTITANATTAPDSTLTADLVTSGGVPNQGLCRGLAGISVVKGNVYTLSFYVLLGTLNANDFKFALYDPVGLNFFVVNMSPSTLPNNLTWTRVVYTFVAPSNAVRIYPYRNPLAITGDFYLWGVQLEEGDIATTYIPTTGTAVTSTAFDAFTFYGEYYSKNTADATNSYLVSLSTNPVLTNHIYISHNTSFIDAEVFNTGVLQFSVVQSVPTPYELHKVAMAVQTNNTAFTSDTNVLSLNATTSVPSPIALGQIGSYVVTPSAAIWNGIIAKVSFWNKRRPDADLLLLAP